MANDIDLWRDMEYCLKFIDATENECKQEWIKEYNSIVDEWNSLYDDVEQEYYKELGV